MTKLRIYIFAFIVLIFSFSEAMANNPDGGYDVNTRCREAWILLMDMDIDGARDLLAQEINENPKNYYAYYLDQTCEAYAMFINSDPDDYERFLDNFEDRRDIMDGHDENSPYYLACYSEMLIQAGLFNILEGDQFSGLRKMYSAYKKVYQNLDKYPDFSMSRKLDGFFNVAIGNLPPFVKSAASVFGVTGDIDGGFKILNENYEDQKDIPGINSEAALFVILTAKINKTPERVYPFVHSLDSSIASTYIHQYFRANVAYRTGHNEEALAVIDQMDTEKNEYTILTSDYLTGKVLMRKLDSNAVFYLNHYLVNHKKEEYYKEIQYYIALYHLFNDDKAAYANHADLVMENGKEMQERDREALYDVSLDYPPSVPLIKAKLLLAGGYIDNANDQLNLVDTSQVIFNGQKIEYILLKAGIAGAQDSTDNAISLYQQVLKLGEDEDYYLASEAALRLGQIYARKGMNEKASYYFKKCIKLYNSDYYEYIEDNARKGLQNM